jgi:hypothetical protein
MHLYESSLCLSHFFINLYKFIRLMNKGSKDYKKKKKKKKALDLIWEVLGFFEPLSIKYVFV